jgi:hypothetical protein
LINCGEVNAQVGDAPGTPQGVVELGKNAGVTRIRSYAYKRKNARIKMLNGSIKMLNE